MKKGILLFVLISTLISCNNDDDSNNSTQAELVGTWKLTENLSDPGDGSGVFEIVISDKKMVFNSDGTVTSNGFLCDMSIESNTSSSGTYSITESTINSSSCNTTEFAIRFELSSTFLIISYPCIEACQAKYLKVE